MRRAPSSKSKKQRGSSKQANDKPKYTWVCNGAYYWNVCTRYAVLPEITVAPETTQEKQPDANPEQQPTQPAAVQPELQINSAVSKEEGAAINKSGIDTPNTITTATHTDTNSGAAGSKAPGRSTNNEGPTVTDVKVTALDSMTIPCNAAAEIRYTDAYVIAVHDCCCHCSRLALMCHRTSLQKVLLAVTHSREHS
jgi:hypothetical protein